MTQRAEHNDPVLHLAAGCLEVLTRIATALERIAELAEQAAAAELKYTIGRDVKVEREVGSTPEISDEDLRKRYGDSR